MQTIVTVYASSQPTDGIMSSLALMDTKCDDIKVINWNPQIKPAFDMFEELKPDLLITDAATTPNLTNSLKQYPCQLIVCGSMPPFDLEPDLLLLADPISDTFKEHCEFPYLVIKPAANIGKFRQGKKDPKKETDILYFASEATPQVDEVDILSVLSGLSHSFRIIGFRRPLLQYIGLTSVYETSDFFASAKITIDINGASEYDVAAQHGFCLSNHKSRLYPHIVEDEFVPETWTQKLEDLLQDESKRKSTAKIAYKKVMGNNTYFHRLADVFNKIGWTKEAQQALDIFKEVTE